jgi:hypothetical protein
MTPLGKEPLTGESVTYKDVPMYVAGKESTAGIIVIQGIIYIDMSAQVEIQFVN